MPWSSHAYRKYRKYKPQGGRKRNPTHVVQLITRIMKASSFAYRIRRQLFAQLKDVFETEDIVNFSRILNVALFLLMQEKGITKDDYVQFEIYFTYGNVYNSNLEGVSAIVRKFELKGEEEVDLTKEENREFLENAIRYFALMGYTVIVELKLVEGDTL